MFDGFGVDYLAESKMPVLGQWKRDGIYKQVKGVMPSGYQRQQCLDLLRHGRKSTALPRIPYFDEKSGEETYAESADPRPCSHPV